MFKQICKRVLKNVEIILITKPIVVTDDEQKLILMKELHDNPLFIGHTGQKRLYAKLRSRYYWKNMSKDVGKFVKSCDECRLTKVTPVNREKLVLTTTPNKPFDVLVIDTIGPLPMSHEGNRYAISIICDLTKYLVMIPIPNKETDCCESNFYEFCFDLRSHEDDIDRLGD